MLYYKSNLNIKESQMTRGKKAKIKSIAKMTGLVVAGICITYGVNVLVKSIKGE